MSIILSIVLATILGFILLLMGPFVGGLLAFGIVAGCIFRGLYLLNEIHNKLFEGSPKTDKIKAVYEEYLKEKEKIDHNQGE